MSELGKSSLTVRLGDPSTYLLVDEALTREERILLADTGLFEIDAIKGLGMDIQTSLLSFTDREHCTKTAHALLEILQPLRGEVELDNETRTFLDLSKHKR